MVGIDRYDIEARYTPSLVSSVPFVLLSYYYLSSLDGSFWTSVLGLTMGSIGFTTAIFLVMINFCRGLAKWIEEKLFARGYSFPTTEFLLDEDNTLSPEMKVRILNKIHEKFGIDLQQKTADSPANRRSIHEAVGQIRNLFYKKNELLLTRNIQFGFAKNLMSGSIIAAVLSTVAVIISVATNTNAALSIAIVLLVIYAVLSLLSFLLVRFTARYYAQTLYDEFIAIK